MKKFVDASRVEIIFDAADLKKIDEAATKVGVLRSEYIRLMCILDRRHKDAKVNAVVKELRRAAS